MRQLFRIVVMGLMGAFIGCGGDSDSPTGPTKGPDGQTLEVYNGEDGDGNRIEYQFYRDGNDLVKHGFYKVYHSDGRVLWERNYVDGKLEGKSVRYYESGKVEYERNYVDGKFEGKWVEYDREGNILDEECYKNDVQVDLSLCE